MTLRKMAVIKCEVCGAQFQRRADWKPRSSDGVSRCRPCNNSFRATGREYPQRRTGKTKVCVTCGKDFYRPGARLGERNCSIVCSSEWRRQQDKAPAMMKKPADNAGERNGRYTTGNRVGQNKGPANKRKTRAVVIERDGDWCLLCGVPGPGLHLHRVLYGSHGGKYEPTNCVQLCAEDHALVHSSKRTWAPILSTHVGGEDQSDKLLAMMTEATAEH